MNDEEDRLASELHSSMPWLDSASISPPDPLGDIHRAAEMIRRSTGMQPTVMLVSSTTKYEIERFYMWLELQKKILAELPWWAIFRYLVISKQVDFSHRGIARRWLEHRRLHRRYARWRFERKYRDDPDFL